MKNTTLGMIAATLALAATLATASADEPRNIATITAGHALTVTLPVRDEDIPTPPHFTSSNEQIEYRETDCRGPWTVAQVMTSEQHSILSGSRIRIRVAPDAQPGSRPIRYRLNGTFMRTRLKSGVVVSTTRETCSTSLIDAQWTVRATSRPGSVPASEAHLSSTAYRSSPVSNPSCYVVATTWKGEAAGGVSMTGCLTPQELYQYGFVDAVPGPPVPATINTAINDYISNRLCRSDEHLPDRPTGEPGSNSCLQPEGWTAHE